MSETKGRKSSIVAGAKKEASSLARERCSDVLPVRGGARMKTGSRSSSRR